MIASFFSVLARGKAPISEAACRGWLGKEFEPFQTAGIFQFRRPSDHILCQACFGQHWLAVEWDAGDECSIARCPIGGTFRVDDADVSMIAVDVSRCLQLLQEALLDRRQRVRELVPDKAWHIGVARTGAIDWNAIVVPGDLSATELARLGDETKKLPQCALDVVLLAEIESWPEIRFARPLHTLSLTDVCDWEQDRITIRSDILGRWLHTFMRSRTERPITVGRPATKTAWLHEHWHHHEEELHRLPTDTARHQLLNEEYQIQTAGQTLSRATVVQVLDQVMPERVKICQ